jgi:ABC-type transport system involved in multi-copper enzyme maturation permease subunit
MAANWARAACTSLSLLLANFALLVVALRAAGAISRERERRTLDSLLTMPYSREEILTAKLMGSVGGARWLWGLVGVVWIIAVVSRGMSVEGLMLTAIACGCYAAFVAWLGLCCSAVCRSTLRATVWTVLLMLLVGFGPALVVRNGARFLSAVLPRPVVRWCGHVQGMEAPPPTALWQLSRFNSNSHSRSEASTPLGALANSVCYGLAAMALWHGTRRRFRGEKGPPPRRPKGAFRM